MTDKQQRLKVWVCLACGKRSKDQYGRQKISAGWDESCMLNSVECYEDLLVLNSAGRVIRIKENPGDSIIQVKLHER